MKTVLIIGFGSIGQRHAQNFKDLGCDVAIVSKRIDFEQKQLYPNLEEALGQKSYDIILVCNETAHHLETLKTLSDNRCKSLILAEKPLVDHYSDDLKNLKNLNLRVTYNFRYSPLLKKLKDQLAEDSALTAMSYVGQYLPTWRPTRDYRQTYSAKKVLGGGVVLDLSHEIDYLYWLFGSPTKVAASTAKLSDLEIDVEDSCGFVAGFQKCGIVVSQLNYIDHIKQRFLIVNTNKSTYHLDFVRHSFLKNQTEQNIGPADTYKLLAQDAVHSGASQLTTLSEAIEIMKTIETIKSQTLRV